MLFGDGPLKKRAMPVVFIYFIFRNTDITLAGFIAMCDIYRIVRLLCLVYKTMSCAHCTRHHIWVLFGLVCGGRKDPYFTPKRLFKVPISTLTLVATITHNSSLPVYCLGSSISLTLALAVLTTLPEEIVRGRDRDRERRRRRRKRKRGRRGEEKDRDYTHTHTA